MAIMLSSVALVVLSYFGGKYLNLALLFGFGIIKVVKYFVKKGRGSLDKDDEIDVDGKVVLVTGASAGIGKAAVTALAERGANVILACRNVQKAQNVVDNIRKRTENGNMTIMELDLASLKSVRNFAKEFKSKFCKLDILINNGGISHPAHVRRTTKDGFEEQFGVNHLGHFLLTNLLLEELKNAKFSRVVIVSSGAHIFGKLNFDDIMHAKSKPPNPLVSFAVSGLYCNSKLANNLFNLELSKRLRGSSVNSYALCPGLVATDIGEGQGYTFFNKFIRPILYKYWAKTAEEGADTIIYCATGKNVSNHSGEMYRNCQFWDASQRPRLSQEDATRLWKLSVELVGGIDNEQSLN